MKTDALDVVCCPSCRGELVIDGGNERGEVTTGSLSCPRCRREFPVARGIPHFVRPEEIEGLNRRFARLYDWSSYLYLPASRIAGGLLGGEERCRREILDRIEPKGGGVLEVSIGPGPNLPYLVGAPGVGRVFGLDVSLGQLTRCRDVSARRGWDVDLFLGVAEQLPFKDGSFDVVFHVGGINFFSNKKGAIEEMIRVARPGTRIVIADETEKGARFYQRVLPTFSRMFDSKRETVEAPVDLVPSTMHELRVFDIWRGFGYCLEFRKPDGKRKRSAARHTRSRA